MIKRRQFIAGLGGVVAWAAAIFVKGLRKIGRRPKGDGRRLGYGALTLLGRAPQPCVISLGETRKTFPSEPTRQSCDHDQRGQACAAPQV